MVRIITDSSSDLEPREYREKNIIHIPLFVNFGGVEYKENENLSKEEFYRLLEQNEEMPKTSQASLGDVEAALKSAMDAGDEVVFITLSSNFSGEYQSICMIKDMLEYENCYVVDSLTGTGGQRLLVEHAAMLRDAGKSAGEIAEELPRIRERMILYCCMDTLEYLLKGGRISHSTYVVGTLAGIKPILTISKDGYPKIPAKVRGHKKGVEFICKQFLKFAPDMEYPIYLMYTDKRRNAELLAQQIEKYGYSIPDSRIIPVGAAIGTHIGPNACGIVYIAKEPME